MEDRASGAKGARKRGPAHRERISAEEYRASKSKRRPCRELEHIEQCGVFAWAALYPELEIMYASANGGARNAVVGAKLKASGVKAGIPDIHLPIARHGYSSLYVEMKVIGGTVIASQLARFPLLEAANNLVLICWSRDEAIQAICQYMDIKVPSWMTSQKKQWIPQK